MAVASWAEAASAEEIVATLGAISAEGLDIDDEGAPTALLVVRLAELDGELAVEIAGALKVAPRQRLEIEDAAYRGWLSVDPVEAFDHALARLPGGSESLAETVASMLSDLRTASGALADRFAAEMVRSADPATREIGETFRRAHLAEFWERNQDAEDALRWIDQTAASLNEQEGMKAELLRLALEGRQNNAAVLALENLPQINDPDLLEAAIQQLADTAPVKVYALIERMPDPQERTEAWQQLLTAQSQSNRELTLARLLAQAPSTDREALLDQATTTLVKLDFRLAFQALAGLQNEQRRTERAYEVGFKWLVADADSARQNVPVEVVRSYDRVIDIYRSGLLDLVPGRTPELSFIRPPNP